MGFVCKRLQQRPVVGCLADRQHMGRLVLGSKPSALDAASRHHILHCGRRLYLDTHELWQRLGCFGGSLALVVRATSTAQTGSAVGTHTGNALKPVLARM